MFPETYRCFYRRQDPRKWRPSPETIAVLEHLAVSGPLTVTEAARHFDRSQSAMSEMFDRIIALDLLKRMAVESGPYCHHCQDSEGNLQAFSERVTRMSQWIHREMPDLSHQQVLAKVLDLMSSMPAWKDHPELKKCRTDDGSSTDVS